MATFTVRNGGHVIGTMEPSKRSFSARATTTTEAALMMRGAGQLYLSLGDVNVDGSFNRHQALLQADGLVDLVGRHGDGFGWCLIPFRSASAHWCAEARREISVAASGVARVPHNIDSYADCPADARDWFGRSAGRDVERFERWRRGRGICQANCVAWFVRTNQSMISKLLSRDLRLLVRRRLVAGDTDQQVLDFLVARYGNFVLLRPQVKFDTLILGLAPVALIAGMAALFLVARRRRMREMLPPALTREEQARVKALLEKHVL